MDHLLVDYHFRDKTKSVLAGLSHDPRRHGQFDLSATFTRLGLLAQWALTARGPLTTNVRYNTGDSISPHTFSLSLSLSPGCRIYGICAFV